MPPSLVHRLMTLCEFKMEFCPAIFGRLILKSDRWSLKKVGHLFNGPPSFVHNFMAIRKFKLVCHPAILKSETNRRFCGLCDLRIGRITLNTIGHLFSATSSSMLCPVNLTFCMNITLVNSNYSRKFHDVPMRGTLCKICNGRTDGWTAPFIKLHRV